jgi:hypothetical protein
MICERFTERYRNVVVVGENAFFKKWI